MKIKKDKRKKLVMNLCKLKFQDEDGNMDAIDG